MQVLTAELGALKDYVYTVIFARYKNQWLFCRAKEREVFETAGGRIEPGETPLEAAKRELFEETGAVEFDIEPAFDYATVRDGAASNGQVFFAQIYTLGDMPDFEMAEVGLFDALPDIANSDENGLDRAENRERFNAFSATGKTDLNRNCYNLRFPEITPILFAHLLAKGETT